MASKIIRLAYKGQVKSIALYAGLDTEELQELLQVAFGTSGIAVGFLSDVSFLVFMNCNALLALIDIFNFLEWIDYSIDACLPLS